MFTERGRVLVGEAGRFERCQFSVRYFSRDMLKSGAGMTLKLPPMTDRAGSPGDASLA